jgi:L-asparaginase
MSCKSDPKIKPRIIIHGGAGNITPDNLPPPQLARYRRSLLKILIASNKYLHSTPAPTALDVAVYAVSLFEDDPLFNCAKGAVFTRAGTNELEASVMISDPKFARKRGAGVMLVKKVKNPIKLAKEVLLRADEEETNGHCQLSGDEVESLAKKWGMELVDEKYFWTKERWEQHRRGLEKESQQGMMPSNGEKAGLRGDATWDPDEYYPQGTVGAVVLDANGLIAVATSTGGLTNKFPGRIGDTPTLGAGFFAEQWMEEISKPHRYPVETPILDKLYDGSYLSIIQDCLPWGSSVFGPNYTSISERTVVKRSVAISGTGNGDSFLRLSACRTICAISRYSEPFVPLSESISRVAGPGGDLQQSAGDRWARTGEGEAGVIGIELIDNKGQIGYDFNRGMFRAYINDNGDAVWGAFRDGEETYSVKELESTSKHDETQSRLR